MKLYFSPAACSLAVHIALREAGWDFELVRVDLCNHTLADGSHYLEVNPAGTVPLLELDDGTRIGEVAAILQYIADRTRTGALAPESGTLQRTRLQEALSFVGTEIHKGSGLLFHPLVHASTKTLMREKVRSKYVLIDRQLTPSGWLVGDDFTVADAYLFFVASGAPHVAIDLHGLEAVDRFLRRMQQRPAVQAAMAAEGLLG